LGVLHPVWEVLEYCVGGRIERKEGEGNGVERPRVAVDSEGEGVISGTLFTCCILINETILF
jgi:hypothetical protein